MLAKPGPQRDLALALIISRVAQPGSKLSTLTWWADTTLGADLGVADAPADGIYAAMDWLAHRQDAIEAGLAARHLAPAANPARMALFDLSSSWLEGTHCPLAARGYSRDGRKGTLQAAWHLGALSLDQDLLHHEDPPVRSCTILHVAGSCLPARA